MNSHVLPSRRERHAGLQDGRARTAVPRDELERGTGPGHRSDHGLAAVARDAGLRTPDSVATPEMAEQTGTPIGVLRWVPVYVAGLAIVLTAGIGLVVLTVL